MNRTPVFFALTIILQAAFISLAHAEQVPAYALEKDFENCMGHENPQKNPERAEYCDCVRNSMKDWSMEAYGQLAMEGAKAKNASEEPAQLQEIAKACVTKVLGAAPQ